MSNEWFERGELPPVGLKVSYFDDNSFPSSQNEKGWKDGDELEILAYALVEGKKTCVVFNLRHGTAQCLITQCMRPIRTEREKAIEAALSVMSTKTISNTQRKTINKLYDAGLLRLPEDKK